MENVMTLPMSHAFVLPDENFEKWLEVVRPYMQAFERVAVVRSPAGNDLNRFRNVTAVQASNVWHKDDALAHIRRAYPMVVRVDVIKADTPQALSAVIQTRINAQDRFGERQNTPQHIFDRFTIEYPTNARPTRITRGFSKDNANKHEGIDIAVYKGADILAAAPGKVTKVVQTDALNYGAYIQITTVINTETFVTTYAGLDTIKAQFDQFVQTGSEIATAKGDTVKIVVQNPSTGLDGYKLPKVVDPTLMVYWQGLRLRTTVTSLRVRSLPNTDGEILGTLTQSDVIETEEVHGHTLAKIGVDGEWLKIRRAGARSAYTAAWYLEAYGVDDPTEAIPGVAVPGINLDLDHPLGTPDPQKLKGQGWVRLKYNVSLNPNKHGDARYGNTDVNFTFNRFRPYLERCAQAGLKVILVLTHQTFGEGQGYVWPQMNTNKWRDLTGKYANIVRQIAALYANTGLVYAYQIWNEQDTPPLDARAAVPMPASDYGYLLAETIKAIRTVDQKAMIITGGHVGGPDAGPTYIRAAFNAMSGGIRPDGVAFHPYGRGPQGHTYSNFGPISESIQKWGRVLPGKPVWMTEWGVLNIQNRLDLAGSVSQYVTGFRDIVAQQFPGKVACAIWYAWADGMDNGYGIVKQDGQPKQPLYDAYLK
jgi:hypothetical protein